MGAGERFDTLVRLMARLRAPDGCPWDREQTMSSLRGYILEEAYELVDALDRARASDIREELGDLLLEVLFVSQIATEEGLFDMEAVLAGLEDKLVRRHPHVFGEEKAADAGRALARWEAIKAEEKPEQESILGDTPRALPALVRAMKLSSRAARVGFDWVSLDDIFEKLAEELQELQAARKSDDHDGMAEEIGDMLFIIVNLARRMGVDPELALDAANQKFTARFRHVEDRLVAQGRSPAQSSLEEMEALWQEAKRKTSSAKDRAKKTPRKRARPSSD